MTALTSAQEQKDPYWDDSPFGTCYDPYEHMEPDPEDVPEPPKFLTFSNYISKASRSAQQSVVCKWLRERESDPAHREGVPAGLLDFAAQPVVKSERQLKREAYPEAEEKRQREREIAQTQEYFSLL